MGMYSQSWDYDRCLMPFYVYWTSLKRSMIDCRLDLLVALGGLGRIELSELLV